LTSPGSLTGAAYLLDKARGLTSRKAASMVARAWGYRKYGHAGTLDPDAAGLLIVLLGKATRLSRFLSSFSKKYSFGMELGMRTDTDDTTGIVLERTAVDGLTRDDILAVLDRFTGRISQRVPSYSAVRVNGRRGYSLARSGEAPEMPVRSVEVRDLKLLEWDGRKAGLSVEVSSGTYVRALARDIGDSLGVGAAAFGIVRTSIDGFSLEEASGDPDVSQSLLTMAGVMRGYPSLILGDEDAERISHGNPVSGEATGITALMDGKGGLLAMARGDGSTLRPMCVMVEG
jgi:tRNA pseudouridine55 synthase